MPSRFCCCGKDALVGPGAAAANRCWPGSVSVSASRSCSAGSLAYLAPRGCEPLGRSCRSVCSRRVGGSCRATVQRARWLRRESERSPRGRRGAVENPASHRCRQGRPRWPQHQRHHKQHAAAAGHPNPPQLSWSAPITKARVMAPIAQVLRCRSPGENRNCCRRRWESREQRLISADQCLHLGGREPNRSSSGWR